jgi:predicted O-methyltransferase YrrM
MSVVPRQGRQELVETLRSIPGWLGDDEAWALHEMVRSQTTTGGPLTVVEIGSWQGRSTIALASGLRSGVGGTLYAVDPHHGTALHETTGVPDTYPAFLDNIREAGLSSYVRTLRARSTDARSDFVDGSVDVLFVDGSHAYADLLRDIDEWVSALAESAAVAFHDATAYPAVKRALDERVLCANSPFRNPNLIQDTLIVDFRRDQSWTVRDVDALARFRASAVWA